MAVTQYIGSRYVPLFADPVEWSPTKSYEALTIVLHEGNSYTSKQAVPVGVELTNEEFWAQTGNYNAQIESYRREVSDYATEVSGYDARLDEITDDISSIESKLDKIKSDDPAKLYVTVEKVGTFPIDPNVFYAQGCTVDFNGNKYVVAARRSASNQALLYKFDDSLSLVGDPVELATHANGIDYDSVLEKIFFYSSNTRLNAIDPESMTIIGSTRQNSNTNVNYSALAFSPDYAIFNVTGTYDYVIFNRYASTLNALGIVHTPSAGPHNFRQDSCIANNVYYQIFSNSSLPSIIRCMSVGGNYCCDFIVENVQVEFEGIYYENGTFYLVDSGFNIYRVNSTLSYTGLIAKTQLVSNVEPIYYQSINTDTTKLIDVTVGNVSGSIMIEAYYDKKHSYLWYRKPFIITIFGYKIVISAGTSGAFVARIQTQHNNLVELTYYSNSAKDLSLYLHAIRYNVNGNEYNLYISQNELYDVEALTTKITNFLTTAINTNGLDLTDLSIGIVGASNWFANNVYVTEYYLSF